MPGRATPAIPPYSDAAAPGEERVDQRVAVVVAGRRVDHETGRLVDDQQVVVLVDDAELDVWRGRQVERDRLRDVEPDLGPGGDDRVRPDGHAVDGQPTVGDELLDVASGQAGRVGHEPVDPAGGPVGDPHGPDARRDRRFRHPAPRGPARPGRSAGHEERAEQQQQDRPG